ncbi:BglG family transcription antiterminator [Enterococcus rivorum]|uniref:Ascorbate-specific PTS system EIIA component n=1 Tax=Enterococcus rivorum TaxID=762845 RepID=A0A1E5KZH9_9ENTE|nr:BglG family transcription antiterminator [Enterococcus rivorum]MBP2099404.1 transcriptional antiterminator/mannitol/fructose-specific phosphotransferase system IIA component (Ntr-type) [Enterococcus rivorum]OEH83266.1 transcriptional antiterminator [Enterococcus rivorum]
MINYRMSYLMSLDFDKKYDLQELVDKIDLNEEELMGQLDTIKNLLSKSYNLEIQWNGQTLFLPKRFPDYWLPLQFEKKEEDIYYNEGERQALIYLLTFSMIEELSVFHFQEFFQVSKNTILADIKKLRLDLKEQNILFVYSRKNGFYLDGKEEQIRIVAHKMVTVAFTTTAGRWGLSKGLLNKSYRLQADVKRNFYKAIEVNELVVVPSRVEETIYFMSYLLCRGEHYSFSTKESEQQLVRCLHVFQASREFVREFPQLKNAEYEADYFGLLFMTIIQGEIRDTSLEFLLEYASKMIHEMERLAAIEFKEFRKLLLNLFYHLVPAYFRIKYHFTLSNVLIDEIKEQYGELFTLTKIALRPFQEYTKTIIPESEIGYFTILFGGEIGNQRQLDRLVRYKALVVCPSGISSSLIMQSELKELFPTIDFKSTTTIQQLESIAETDYDVIFSTIPIQSLKRHYVINPIMTQLEKNQLIRSVQKDVLIPGIVAPSVDEILASLLPYIQLKEGVTKEKLYHVLNRKMMKKLKSKEDEKPMLSDLLTKDMIQLSDEEMTWEEAIVLSAKPLKDSDKITDNYIEAMIDKVKDYGPFIHIGKSIALPHARPEDGVKSLGMSLLKLTHPVNLLEDEKHEISIFICLAAVDNEMHLKALASLTKILSNKENLEQLLNAKTKQEIIELLE